MLVCGQDRPKSPRTKGSSAWAGQARACLANVASYRALSARGLASPCQRHSHRRRQTRLAGWPGSRSHCYPTLPCIENGSQNGPSISRLCFTERKGCPRTTYLTTYRNPAGASEEKKKIEHYADAEGGQAGQKKPRSARPPRSRVNIGHGGFAYSV